VAAGDLAKALRENVGMRFVVFGLKWYLPIGGGQAPEPPAVGREEG